MHFSRVKHIQFLEPNDPRLLLNTTITGVDYSDDGTVIHTNNGCIEADYAIVTFSLGVLQNEVIELSLSCPSGSSPQWKQSTMPVLKTVHIRKYSCSLKRHSEKKIRSSFYGQTFISHRFMSRAFGSFSNWAPSTSLATHQNPRNNPGKLFFAGEATSQGFFGYLHGAWFEGNAVGNLIASRIQGSINCTHEGGQPRYPVLKGVSPYDMYNEENGWIAHTVSR